LPLSQEDRLLNQVKALEDEIRKLEAKLETNKVFTYMVIHDLKHPNESVVSQLGVLQIKI
jgi:hypothetical protein